MSAFFGGGPGVVEGAVRLMGKVKIPVDFRTEKLYSNYRTGCHWPARAALRMSGLEGKAHEEDF
jgi:hypothetical protein